MVEIHKLKKEGAVFHLTNNKIIMDYGLISRSLIIFLTIVILEKSYLNKILKRIEKLKIQLRALLKKVSNIKRFA